MMESGPNYKIVLTSIPQNVFGKDISRLCTLYRAANTKKAPQIRDLLATTLHLGFF